MITVDIWPDSVKGEISPTPESVLREAVQELNGLKAPFKADLETADGENGGKNYHLVLTKDGHRYDVSSLLVPMHGGYPATVAFTSNGYNRFLKVLDEDQLILALRETVTLAVREQEG